MGATETVLNERREEIEAIDRSLVFLLAARSHAVGRLLEFKRQAGLPRIDPEQEHRVLSRSRTWARSVGLDPSLVQTIFRHLLSSTSAEAAETPGRPELELVTVRVDGAGWVGAEAARRPANPVAVVSGPPT